MKFSSMHVQPNEEILKPRLILRIKFRTSRSSIVIVHSLCSHGFTGENSKPACATGCSVECKTYMVALLIALFHTIRYPFCLPSVSMLLFELMLICSYLREQKVLFPHVMTSVQYRSE